MIVTPSTVNIKLPKSPVPRSAGIHVSNLIRGIALETGILKPEYGDDLGLTDIREITDPVACLRISIGLAWEAWYIPHILSAEGVVDHPGEMCVDGIFMTHDGESLDVIITPASATPKGVIPVLRIHEIKATYKSLNTVKDIHKQFMWLAQIKAYCKGAKTRYAKLHVLFLCGDYKMPIKPQLLCWDISFTQEEIDKNWELMVDYRDQRQ